MSEPKSLKERLKNELVEGAGELLAAPPKTEHNGYTLTMRSGRGTVWLAIQQFALATLVFWIGAQFDNVAANMPILMVAGALGNLSFHTVKQMNHSMVFDWANGTVAVHYGSIFSRRKSQAFELEGLKVELLKNPSPRFLPPSWLLIVTRELPSHKTLVVASSRSREKLVGAYNEIAVMLGQQELETHVPGLSVA